MSEISEYTHNRGSVLNVLGGPDTGRFTQASDVRGCEIISESHDYVPAPGNEWFRINSCFNFLFLLYGECVKCCLVRAINYM